MKERVRLAASTDTFGTVRLLWGPHQVSALRAHQWVCIGAGGWTALEGGHMSIKSDKWIRRMAIQHRMIEPFAEDQVRDGVISYGVSSYGYESA